MRRLMTILLMTTMVMALGAVHANAQTCRGSVPIGTGGFKGNGGVAMAFDKSIASYAGTIGGGNDTTYGAASIGVNHYDDLGATSFGAGGLFGGQVAADPARKVVICPFGGVSTEWASDFGGSGIDFFALGINAGVSVGFVAASTPTVQVVPAIGFTVTRLRAKFSGFGESFTVTDTIGAIQFGVGLVLNSRTAITPGVAIPIGVEDGNAAFSLSVTYGFGKR